jgi:hypothetical protein
MPRVANRTVWYGVPPSAIEGHDDDDVLVALE